MMLRWLKRLRQKSVPLTVREIELLARENDEARRQAVADPPLQVFSETPPWMPLTSMPRFFLRWRGRSASRRPVTLTDRERELLAQANDESRRQAMSDPPYGTFSSRSLSATHFFATLKDKIGQSSDSAAKERGDETTPPGPRK